MKLLLSSLVLGCLSNAIVHHMITEKLFEKLKIDDKATKYLIMSNPDMFGIGEHQMEQMNPLMTMMLLDSGSNDNSKLMMMAMMQNGGEIDIEAMMPMLLLKDDSLDFKSLYLMTTMMNKGKTLLSFILKTFHSKNDLF